VESSEATVMQTCETSLREHPRVSEKIETVKLFTCCSRVLADSGPEGQWVFT
jgi:hypothetical protein